MSCCKCLFKRIQAKTENGMVELVISSSINLPKDTSSLSKVRHCYPKSSKELITMPKPRAVLQECHLIIKYGISDCIMDSIWAYAMGKICECMHCGIQDHVNNDIYDQKRDTSKWIFCSNHFVFDQDDTNMVCRICFNKLIKDNDISSSETSVDDSIIISTPESVEKWNISEILTQIELVRSLLIPHDIILLLTDFAHGEIIQCVYCEKEDHMDTSTRVNMENTLEWTFCHQYNRESFDLYDTICKECHDRYLCQICSDHLNRNNYECGACKMTVCTRCDENGFHLAKHAEFNLDLPRRNYQEYLESMLLMSYS